MLEHLHILAGHRLCLQPAGDCLFEYVKQPPSTTIQDCSPYSSNDILHVPVQCTVRTRNHLQYYGDYKINWFKESTPGNVVNQGEGYYSQEPITTATRINISSTYFFSQQYNTSFLGKYWCQVINTTADPDQPLMRSNVFTLLPPDNYMYTGPSCTSPQAIDNISCADLPHTIYIFLMQTLHHIHQIKYNLHVLLVSNIST